MNQQQDHHTTKGLVPYRSAAPVLPRNTVLVGDALDQLRRLPDASVDCLVSSPPYFQLRDYHHPDQLGLEPNIETWVERLVEVLVEARRVLKPTGTIWLNLGDSYARQPASGAPPKSLLLGPERLCLELVRRGFTVRNKIVWAKTNPMPASVRDRLNTTWEPLYLLVSGRDYYFDLDAIRIPHRSQPTARPTGTARRSQTKHQHWRGPLAGDQAGLERLHTNGTAGHPLGKNPGDVWTTASSNYRGDHGATFPEALIEPAILAGCPERLCRNCDRPWTRTIKNLGRLAVRGELAPDCACGRWWRRGVVLDPFIGSGTTAVVAERLRRDWVGIDIRADFATQTYQRLGTKQTTPSAVAPRPDQAAA
jgi:DNA modification methylase